MIGPLALPAALRRVPGWVWIGLGAILLLVAFYFTLQAYGDSRYREGVSDERAAWAKAEAELLKRAGEASTKADKQAAARAAEHAAVVAEERERIDNAVKNGSSPLDAIFGTDD